MSYKLMATLILLGLVVIFAIQNVSVVEIKFLLWSFEISRALLYFLLLSVGVISGWLLQSYTRHQRGKS